MKEITFNRFTRTGVIPVLVFDRAEYAVDTSGALIEGGLDILEVTLRTDQSWQALEMVVKQFPEALIGVGTVRSIEQMTRAVDLGAAFAVSPGLIPELVEYAHSLEFDYLPGVTTATELMQASNLGLSHLKFFPAEAVGGVKLLNSLGSPFPDISFCPTGGINQQNLADYLALSNVFCIGGSWIATAQDMQTRDWAAITEKARLGLSVAQSHIC